MGHGVDSLGNWVESGKEGKEVDSTNAFAGKVVQMDRFRLNIEIMWDKARFLKVIETG